MSSEKREGHLCTSQLHIPFAGYSLGFVLLSSILFICLQFKSTVHVATEQRSLTTVVVKPYRWYELNLQSVVAIPVSGEERPEG